MPTCLFVKGKPEATAFKGEVRRGRGVIQPVNIPHPHPCPPLEREGVFSADD
jgi:hypothetical protein